MYQEDAAIIGLLAKKEGVKLFCSLATILVRAYNVFGTDLMA